MEDLRSDFALGQVVYSFSFARSNIFVFVCEVLTCHLFLDDIFFNRDFVTYDLGSLHSFLWQHWSSSVFIVVEEATQLQLAIQVGFQVAQEWKITYLTMQRVAALDCLVGEYCLQVLDPIWDVRIWLRPLQVNRLSCAGLFKVEIGKDVSSWTMTPVFVGYDFKSLTLVHGPHSIRN